MSTAVVPSAPPRSIEQRMAALQRGNQVRSQRAQLKRDLKAGRATVIPLIASPPAWAETMKLGDLLLAVPKVGRVKVNKALVRCRVATSKTLGGLSDRQRRELIDLMSLWPVVRNPQACELPPVALRSRTAASGGTTS